MSELETLRQLIDLANQIGDHPPNTTPPQLQRWVLVRGDRSGVFYGLAVYEHDQTIDLEQCRRIHYWDGAASTVELAERGVSRPDNCKFTGRASRVRVLDAIEVHDMTLEARKVLDAVPDWSEFA